MKKYTLREARKLRGMNQRELAKAANLSPGLVNRIESPIHPFATHIRVARALAKALDLRVDQILWPRGLSTLGRPPHTGGNKIVRRRTITTSTTTTSETTITEEEVVLAPEDCLRCNTVFANNGECLCDP